MTLRLLPVLLAAALLPARVAAQAVEAGAFSLPDLDATARGAALGGSPSAALGPDAGSFLYNPALLTDAGSDRVALGYLDHLSSLRIGTLTYARAVSPVGMMAGAVRFLGWGAVPRTDESGAEDGEFRANELGLSVTASRPYTDRIRYGATLHFLRSSVDGHAATAFAADAGATMHFEERLLTLSASVHRLGVVLGSIGAEADELRPDVRLGVAKRLRYLPVLFTVTAYGLTAWDTDEDDIAFLDRAFRHLLLGTEFQFSDAFQVRFGYDQRRHAALKTGSRLDVAGFSLGAGLHVRRVGIDYAWSSWSSLGGLHRFTVTTRI
jgi:hypothetical protein